jgi:hypothetical protein
MTSRLSSLWGYYLHLVDFVQENYEDWNFSLITWPSSEGLSGLGSNGCALIIRFSEVELVFNQLLEREIGCFGYFNSTEESSIRYDSLDLYSMDLNRSCALRKLSVVYPASLPEFITSVPCSTHYKFIAAFGMLSYGHLVGDISGHLLYSPIKLKYTSRTECLHSCLYSLSKRSFNEMGSGW